MADEKKPTTKKADAAKASADKAEAKKGARKSDAKKASPKKDAAAKKPGKKAAAKKAPKKTAKAKKEPAKKAAPKARKAPAAPPVVRASARYVRIAPRKARLIADQVRGLHIEKARALLQFSPRGAAQDIHKLIDSAAANAENNHDLVADDLKIGKAYVDEGPTLKRYRPRALGRATRIRKRTSHMTIELVSKG